eukprot:gene25686-31412_t
MRWPGQSVHSIPNAEEVDEGGGTQPDEQVEVAVILSIRIMPSKFHPVMRSLRFGLQQQLLGCRLGWPNVFTKSHPSGRYLLNCREDEQLEIAKYLVALAIKDTSKQSFNNVLLNGRRITNPVENSSLWNFMTSATTTPMMEFDFFGTDVWQTLQCGKPSDSTA